VSAVLTIAEPQVPGDDEDGEDSDDWVPSRAGCKVRD